MHFFLSFFAWIQLLLLQQPPVAGSGHQGLSQEGRERKTVRRPRSRAQMEADSLLFLPVFTEFLYLNTGTQVYYRSGTYFNA